MTSIDSDTFAGELGTPAAPVTAPLALTTRKWTRSILVRLPAADRLQYCELKAELDGISDKMLSDSLAVLERRGLVDRVVVDARPVRVEYTLTDAGVALVAVIDELLEWDRRHAD